MVQNRAVMEDVLQESYIKAWRNFDRFDGDADQFMAWLHRIVVEHRLETILNYKGT